MKNTQTSERLGLEEMQGWEQTKSPAWSYVFLMIIGYVLLAFIMFRNFLEQLFAAPRRR